MEESIGQDRTPVNLQVLQRENYGVLGRAASGKPTHTVVNIIHHFTEYYAQWIRR
jgi:hypothetical protein